MLTQLIVTTEIATNTAAKTFEKKTEFPEDAGATTTVPPELELPDDGVNVFTTVPI